MMLRKENQFQRPLLSIRCFLAYDTSVDNFFTPRIFFILLQLSAMESDKLATHFWLKETKNQFGQALGIFSHQLSRPRKANE